MCHSNDCDVALHFLSQRLLYNRICLVICPRQPESERISIDIRQPELTDSRRGFIEDQELALSQDSSRKGNDLPLSNRQVRASASDLRVQRDPAAFVYLLL